EAYHIDVPPHEVAYSGAECVAAASRLGYPVVMKLMADGLVHRTEVGGVALNLSSASAVRKQRAAFRAIAQKLGLKGSRILLTEMISGGVEVIIGGYRDPQFGPVVMFGLGGVFVEVLNDVAFRLAPIDMA